MSCDTKNSATSGRVSCCLLVIIFTANKYFFCIDFRSENIISLILITADLLE